jgi:Schlafen, AlbA_2
MDIQDLVKQPRESLTVELKSWIDPDSPEGTATLVKAAIAMRNNNGGYILIGFDNDSCQPIHENVPDNVQELFHQDKIQGVVTKNASESFEVEIHFPEIEGNIFPVIEIPTGVRIPVGTKRDFVDKTNGKIYIPQNKIYVRSLNSNNTPSTTEATWKDWDQLVEKCFDNREADIGRFLRRHIGGLNPDLIKEFAASISEGMQPEISLEESLRSFLEKGYEHFQEKAKERDISPGEFGTWEVATIINGEIPLHSLNLDFLKLIHSSNPKYSGWSPWVILNTPRDKESKPYVFEGAWESFILSLANDWNSLDFWRIEPSGHFYLLQALDDDFSGYGYAPQPYEAFDFGTPIFKVGEVLAVTNAFAKAMGCDPEQTTLHHIFRWKKLRDRKLCSWRYPERYITPGRTAYKDEAESEITIGLDIPNSALASYVYQATKPLLEVFDDFQIGLSVVEEITRKVIERRH